jgi:hypothetical protein
MCTIVVINRGEKEIGTPREFLEHFKVMPDFEMYFNKVDMDACLCQCDLDTTFVCNEIAYKIIDGDYYVGKLDELT